MLRTLYRLYINVYIPEPIQLAKAVASINLPTDPDFENDSIEECLARCLTLPAGQKFTDLFK